jgi:hypothetical protein
MGVETTTAAHTEALQPSPEAIATDDDALVGTRAGAVEGTRKGAVMGTRESAVMGTREGAVMGTRKGAVMGTRDGANVAIPVAEAVATPRGIATAGEAIATNDDDVDDRVLDDLWLADRIAPAMAPTPHTPRFGQREAEVAGAIFGPVPQQLDGQLDGQLDWTLLARHSLARHSLARELALHLIRISTPSRCFLVNQAFLIDTRADWPLYQCRSGN